jgi:pyruvate,water dikinase
VLEGHSFVLIGPGRWGSANIQLGVPVTYADIYNASALVELALSYHGTTPEPSYGTHFFQDLVESQIFPLAVYPDDRNDFLNWDFLLRATNALRQVLPETATSYEPLVKLIHVPSNCKGCQLQILMNGETALGYFATGNGGQKANGSSMRARLPIPATTGE